MILWTLSLLLVALISGVIGFFMVTGVAAGVAKVLFVVFLTLFCAAVMFDRGL